MKALLVLCFTAQAACALTPHAEPVSRQPNGAAVLLDLTPANRPALVGALDFDLLDAETGAACADRGSAKTYWVSIAELATVSSDSLTRQAIAAAVTDAVSRLDDIDGILLTRVVTESRGPDRVCAKIVGRGVRLTKAHQEASPGRSPQSHEPDSEPADQGSDDSVPDE